MRKHKTFFCLWQLCPIERGGGAVAWLVGTLGAPSVQGHGLPPLQDFSPSQSFFEPPVAGNQKASLASLSP